MSHWAPPFYSLTLTPEDKIRIHQEIFELVYHGNGFTHDEVYSMPIFLRYFYLRLLIKQKESEAKQLKEEDSDYSPRPKPVARPF